jgi:hypothetical protein
MSMARPNVGVARAAAGHPATDGLLGSSDAVDCRMGRLVSGWNVNSELGICYGNRTVGIKVDSRWESLWIVTEELSGAGIPRAARNDISKMGMTPLKNWA